MKKLSIVHRRVLDDAQADIGALYRTFHISEQGYSEEQVEKSRARYGENVLSGRTADTVFYRLRRAFVNPFTVILFVLAVISFLTDVVLVSNFSRNVTTPVIILGMLLTSGVVRFVQELRAKRIADHLTQMVSSTVLVLRDGQWVKLSSTELVVGDQVRLLAGDRVPADIRLTAAKDLFVSQSVLTGESAIVEKSAGVLPRGQARSYADCSNLVFMGSSVTGGTGEGIVLAVGEDILYFLARNRGEVFTKEQIYQAVWENDYLLDDSNIMAFIRKLRKKIEPNPDSPEYILTIWGIGYKFNDKL